MTACNLGPVVLDVQGLTLTPEEAELLRHPMVGGVILFTRNFDNIAQLQRLVEQIRHERPELVLAVDQEGGRVQRLREGFTRIPPMQRIGNLWQRDTAFGERVARECGWLMASEVLATGIDISFAPVLDVDDHCSSIIGDRAFAPDPEIVTAAARAFMDGMHQAGMATTGKHFPGHGSVHADSHLELPVDERDLSAVRGHDLRPFVALIDALDAVMPAHMLFPNINDDLVGFSRWWLGELLRGEMRFDGVIFSDDLSMAGAAAGGSYCERAEKALHAGCDAVLVCNSPADARAVVEYLVEVGAAPSARLARMRARARVDSMAALRETPRYREAQRLLNQCSE